MINISLNSGKDIIFRANSIHLVERVCSVPFLNLRIEARNIDVLPFAHADGTIFIQIKFLEDLINLHALGLVILDFVS